MKEPQKKRNFQYDFLRAFAIITVLVAHILTGYGNTSLASEIKQYINTTVRFSTTMFIFLSGALFHTENININYLKKKFSRILIPYTIISIPAICYQIWLYNWKFSNWKEILASYVFGEKFGFYFIFLIICIEIIGFLIVKKQLHKKINTVLITTLIIQSIWMFFDQRIFDFYNLKERYFLQFNLDNFLFYRNPLPWIPFFILGLWYQVKSNQELIKSKKKEIIYTLIIVFTILNIMMFCNIGDYTPHGSVIWTLFSMILTLAILNIEVKKDWIKKISLYLSKRSFSIFLIHFFFIYLIKELSIINNWTIPYWIAPLILIGILFTTLGIIEIIKKIFGEKSKFIIGS